MNSTPNNPPAAMSLDYAQRGFPIGEKTWPWLAVAFSVVASAGASFWVTTGWSVAFLVGAAVQGVVVGAAIAALMRRNQADLQGWIILGVLACAVVSAVAGTLTFYAGSYVRAVETRREGVAHHISSLLAQGKTSKHPDVILASRNAGKPYDDFDSAVLLPTTGRVGFCGFIRYAGPQYWGPAVIEALICAGVALRFGRPTGGARMEASPTVGAIRA